MLLFQGGEKKHSGILANDPEINETSYPEIQVQNSNLAQSNGGVRRRNDLQSL